MVIGPKLQTVFPSNQMNTAAKPTPEPAAAASVSTPMDFMQHLKSDSPYIKKQPSSSSSQATFQDTTNMTPSTFASADFNLLQSNTYYSPITEPQQQTDMFELNDEIAFNQFLGQMQQQNMMPFTDFNLSIHSPFLFNQQNLLTDELALYRVAPQEDTMGISITRATDNSPNTTTTYLSNYTFDLPPQQ